MKYAIVYNEKEIAYEGEMPDGAVIYYDPKKYFCKVCDTEREQSDVKVAIEPCIGKQLTTELKASNYPNEKGWN